VSKESAEHPGYSVEPSKPSCLSNTVEVHSQTPPLCPRPPSFTPVVALWTGDARQCAVAEADDREYSRHGMPVTKPHIASSFITGLEFVIEQTELNLRWKASAANGRIRGNTVEISDDRPAVAYLHRNWSKKSADLGVRRASQYPSTTGIIDRLLTMT